VNQDSIRIIQVKIHVNRVPKVHTTLLKGRRNATNVEPVNSRTKRVNPGVKNVPPVNILMEKDLPQMDNARIVEPVNFREIQVKSPVPLAKDVLLVNLQVIQGRMCVQIAVVVNTNLRRVSNRARVVRQDIFKIKLVPTKSMVVKYALKVGLRT